MLLIDMYKLAKSNNQTGIARFMRDMRKAKLRMREYHGRFHWYGPAVTVDNLQDALSATKVPCTWDNMGLGYIVYPKESLRRRAAN